MYHAQKNRKLKVNTWISLMNINNRNIDNNNNNNNNIKKTKKDKNQY